MTAGEKDSPTEPGMNGSGDGEDGSTAATEKKPGAGGDGNPPVVMFEDASFCIKIQAPGQQQPFELPVTSLELVQEINQVLMDREDTCHRTCFSLQLEGNTLDNFSELKSIEGLKDGALIKVVEEPYTIREAKCHVRHVRDLLKSVDYADAYNGQEGMSLSFVNLVTAGDILENKKGKPDSLDCTPPDFIMPGSKERPLLPLNPGLQELKAPKCLKVLTLTGWNPPPGNRKLHGDLLYIYVVTLEDKKYHITACPLGFYINHSTDEEFNPRPVNNKIYHSLIDLLNQISPAFKRNFAILLKKRAFKHPFERVMGPYQVYSWVTPPMEHLVDSIRGEDAFATRLGYEEHIPGQTRDWNEEIQTTRELPRKTLPERLMRERAIFKVHGDFVGAATRGAMAVIDGNVMAINPGDDTKMQMFIWNNIFFSLGFDVKDHYKEFGGDAAAYAAPACDLQGVKAYTNLDQEGLYTLGTVLVDYRGYRVTAQSIIPGILEREQDQSVVYGSVDFGKTVVTDDKYRDLLKKSSSNLKIKPHKVVNNKDEVIELFSSVDCKGIIGNDKRYYVLDLLRTYPPDTNYLPASADDLSPQMKEKGYPKQYKHKLTTLRQELIEAYIETKYIEFVRKAAYEFQQLRLKQAQAEDKEKGEEESKEKKDELEVRMDKLVSNKEGEKNADISTDDAKGFMKALGESEIEESTREIVKAAARSVGSLSDTEFDISFNPDVYQPFVTHFEKEGEEFKAEKQLVVDVAEFLVFHQVPVFVRDCLNHSLTPVDGITLTEALHNRGINMRYLGRVAEQVQQHPQLSFVHSITVAEMISRAAKHLYQKYMHNVEHMSLSQAISHFLNCYLGSHPSPHTQVMSEEFQRKKKSKGGKVKNKAGVLVYNHDNSEWISETPKTLWKKIVEDVQNHYDFKLEGDNMDTAVETYHMQKISLLRAFCKKLGIQLMLREYYMDLRHKQCFYEEDIVNTFPVTKHIHHKATDAYQFFTSGQNKIQQGLLREGYELIGEALNLLTNVYGALHPEIAACMRLLARLNYIMGDYGEALNFQQKAVIMTERVLGVDHPNTITEYAHFALYCFAGGQIPSALQLMYRARYLSLLCHDEDHPNMALYDSNIGLILHAAGQYELSLSFLENALKLNTRFYGTQSLKVAMGYHLVARTHSCIGDFRTALQNEKEAYTIYKSLLGEKHDRTQESSECLRHLTEQAVEFQRRINDIYKGEKNVSFPPLQIQVPSLVNILQILNAINGIELIQWVQLSKEDVEKLRGVDTNNRATIEEIDGDQPSETKSKPSDDLKSGVPTSAPTEQPVLVNGSAPSHTENNAVDS
ncbi:clustered mitochondria protein homolog isoform X4 [Lingula anatina]|uniref:Clustered mitochondria protein homolog n=1 Tax=Lingula anatina TaxID=7574 RepID=A0A1S3HDU6_LINAN|nr:clustered mitochondria protein homolog isoform X3 [Lingula anatina]XP_013383661.1 clustered mitochondria protein homolog isoform X4 [Lingula anatina]|eukprot:XP_013383660.1 clustered mitochondria protein homolog isoform X3 [Lingula anatina]